MAPIVRALIFISYAHRDGVALAVRLATDLVSNGYRTWLDRHRLAAGATWSTDIEQALDECDVVLALLSPGSLKSDICRAEQLRALRHGKRVIPIGLVDGVDRPIFLETKQYISFAPTRSYEDAARDLIAAIERAEQPKLATQYRNTYVTAPRLPAKTVPRPSELDSLRARVLQDERSATIAAVAVTGMAGTGKSTLVQMLCHEQCVQDAFPDGVIWVSVGQDVTDLVPKMREVGKALGDDVTRYDTGDGASNQLRTCLSRKTALVVLDDIWQITHIRPFLADAPNSCLLFTTRLHDISTSLEAVRVDVGTLSVAQALDVLARWTAIPSSDLPREAMEVVHACGRLPLALGMIGGLVRGRIDSGRRDAWATVLYSLETAQLDRIRFPLEDYPYPELQRAIQVSVDVLDPESNARYLGMCVFPEDTPVPERVFETLWKVTPYDVQETVDRWVSASLARRLGDDTVLLHDLQLDYVKRIAGNDLGNRHQRLVDRYAEARGAQWPAGDDDGYFFQRVTWHLAAAQNWAVLANILLNPAFIRAKLDVLSYLELHQDFRWMHECRRATAAPADQELLDRLAREVNDLRTFVGRKAETAAIETWLTSGEDRFLAILGVGGLGRTWLLRNLWVRNFRSALLYEIDSSNSSSWCVDFVASLFRLVVGEWDPRIGSRPVAELCSLAREVLERFAGPVYVFVDGLDDFYMVRDRRFLDLLECFRELSSARTRFVISSRQGFLADELIGALPGTRKFLLPELSQDAAASLLLHLIQSETRSLAADDVERLLQRAGGNPFKLSLLAQVLQEGTSVSSLFEALDNSSYLVAQVIGRMLSSGPAEALNMVLTQLAVSGADVLIENIVHDPEARVSTIESFKRSSLFEVTEDGGAHSVRVQPELVPHLRRHYHLED
jgi:hypothetical protein